MAGSSNGDVKLATYRQYAMKHLPNEVSTIYTKVDFILGFAREQYDATGGTGVFKATWGGDVNVKNLTELKEKYPDKVRVIISIGGVGSNYPFEPNQKESWIENAVRSIRQIIHENNNIIDGIDIHYDVIKTTEEEFSSCIGDVINQLKNDKTIKITVVSIAPFKTNKSYYDTLYFNHTCNINLVDYQFYRDTFEKWEDVVALYNELKDYYKPTPDAKPIDVLPGINKPTTYVLDQAFKYLVKNRLIPGYFVWNDDGIVFGSDPLSIEEIIQTNP